MKSKIIENHILNIIDHHNKAGRKRIEEGLAAHGIVAEKTTVLRHINKLVSAGILLRQGSGRSTVYLRDDLHAYFELPPTERPAKGYDFSLLDRYEPNGEGFFTKQELALLARNSEFVIEDASTYLKNLYLKLVVDLSYASSKFEGNTYTYADTQALIELGEPASGKTEEETIMVLNHRNCVSYLFDNIDSFELTPTTIKEFHSLLSIDLIQRRYVGVTRDVVVGIGGSSYTPLDNRFQLEEELLRILNLAGQIENPFEQSLFLLVFLSYLQLFWDVNKRTARLTANIPLLKNHLFPLSFITMKKSDYIRGLLTFYELHRIEPLKQAYIEGYLKSIDRYKDKADIIRTSARETLIFRSAIRTGVHRYVRGYPTLSVRDIVAELADAKTISDHDNEYLNKAGIDKVKFLVREIQDAIDSLNSTNCIAYGVSRDEWREYEKYSAK